MRRVLLTLAVFAGFGTVWAQSTSTSFATTHCVHVIPVPDQPSIQQFYTVTDPTTASCNAGDRGGYTSVYNGDSIITASGADISHVDGGSEAGAVFENKDFILYPFDGVAHVTITISQGGVDDGGGASSAASFWLDGVTKASMNSGFTVPPSSSSQSWTFDVPFKDGIAIPYTTYNHVHISASYGSVQARSTLTFGISVTPDDGALLLSFFYS